MRKEKIANYHIAKEVKRVLKKLYGDRLDKVLLYGSYARGEQTAESYMDFMVVLNKKEIELFDEITAIRSQVNDLELKYDVILSTQPYTKYYYENNDGVYIKNVKKDGIAV